jgi:ABC-2 type transport system permease protein
MTDLAGVRRPAILAGPRAGSSTRPQARHRRPTPSTLQQWWVLTVRVITPTLRNGEVLTQIAASVLFTAGFYIPLKQLMGAFTLGMSSYAQYLMPLIALQAISFAAISGAFRSATDSVQGINRRFQSMPIAPLTPLGSRMSASMYRCCLALVISLLCGHVIGFRFYGDAGHTVGFVLLALLIGATLSFLGDLIGAATKNPEATTHLMVLPQLIFGLLSVGIQPVEQFPEWIQPFVRNQPVSQFVYALRALAGDSTDAAGAVTWSVTGPALAWALGLMVVLVPLHGFVSTRRR